MPVTRTKELAWQPKVRDVLAYLFYGFGTAAPSDGEGAGTANKGSLFVDYINGNVYYNVGSRTSPEWLPLGGGTSAGVKYLDDVSVRFGDGTSEASETVSDRRFYYDSTNQKMVFEAIREAATSPEYARGLDIVLGPSDDFFSHTGARKSWGVYISGDRPDTSVMGGDANDMVLRLGYTNYAVNTPAGSYARGFDISMTNRDAGVLSALQGQFISVRQRSTGDVASLEGIQIDVKIDAGKASPSGELTGARVEMDLGNAAACAASYGVVVRNRTDGALTPPTAAFKAYQDGTSSCKGFSYGLDLLSSTTVKTVDLGDIRFSQTDGTLPCVLFTGVATDDASIVADVGADSLWADGCIYISVVSGAGTIWQKRNGTWTAF